MLDSNTMLIGINFVAFVVNLTLYFVWDNPVNLICAGTSFVGICAAAYGKHMERVPVKFERKFYE